MVRELEGCGGRVKPDEVWAELHPGLAFLCVQFRSRHRSLREKGLLSWEAWNPLWHK